MQSQWELIFREARRNSAGTARKRRRISLLLVPRDGVGRESKRRARLAVLGRAAATAAPRMRHTSDICHLTEPIPDVESGVRRGSVAEAPRRCGFDEGLSRY